jgi:hypothetical protein
MIYKSIFFLIILSVILAATPLSTINSLRKKSGATTLQYNNKLATAAYKHALYVNKNSLLGHYEDSSYSYYYGNAPWDRVLKAGFGTAVVVENISFYEKNYSASIAKLMGTVYHRLAFLTLEVDSIGYASFGKIYVYDMSNSKVAALCRRHFKNAPMIINGVCPKSSDIIPENLFKSAMHKMKRRAKSVVIYPYRNQKGVPLKGVEETPKFLRRSFGFPVTITFNSSYGVKVFLKSFRFYKGSKEISGKIVTSKNDIHKKIMPNTFVFAPDSALSRGSNYHVKVVALVNGKQKVVEWSFMTR